MPTKYNILRINNIIYINRLTTFVTNEIFQFTVPIIALLATGKIWSSGIVFAIEWIFRLITLALGSKLSSYLWTDNEKNLIIGRIIGAIIVFISYLAHNSINFLLLILFISIGAGICGAFFQFSFLKIENIAVQIGGESSSTHYSIQSKLSAIDQLSSMLGPVASGFLLTYSPYIPIIVYIIFCILEGILYTQDIYASNKKFTPLKETTSWLSGFNYLKQNQVLAFLAGGAFINNAIFGTLLASFPALGIFKYQFTPATLGIISTTAAFCAIVCTLLIPKFVIPEKLSQVNIIAILGISICSMGFSLLYSKLAFIMLVIICFIFDCIVAVTFRGIRATIIPKNQYKAVMSSILFINFIPIPFAGILSSSFLRYNMLNVLFFILSIIAFIFIIKNKKYFNKA